MITRLLPSILIITAAVASCAPAHSPVMVERPNGTRYPLPLPKRCTPATDLHLRSKDLKRISAYISQRNRMEWPVDVRRHDVCLIELVTHNHLGLIKVTSTLASHWEDEYFINGSRGITLIEWTEQPDEVTTNIKAALAKHSRDFSADELSRMQRYFGE